ncbi:MAG: proline racemase family protein [Propionibacteriaceae bacterium]|jgi:proline racemase|nr:proline racemase family protein [Propionibacteriaceae bacterium]
MTVTSARSFDYHCGGQALRIVDDPPVAIAGQTAAERRASAIASPQVDGLRKLLSWEPRGLAAMCGAFVVPPDNSGADLGAVFFRRDGFPSACGHGAIALGVWAANSGQVALRPDGWTDVRIDTPSGRVVTRLACEDQRVRSAECVAVPSYHLAEDVVVKTDFGEAVASVAYAGEIVVQCDVGRLGLGVGVEDLPKLVAVGRRLIADIGRTGHAQHPSDRRLDGIAAAVLYEDRGQVESPWGTRRLMQRLVTVYADGGVDRSVCGSGLAARVATLTAQRKLDSYDELVAESVIGQTSTARFSATVAEGRSAVVPVFTGMAHQLGKATFTVDPADPLADGFWLG